MSTFNTTDEALDRDSRAARDVGRGAVDDVSALSHAA
jgi:hypothetical protein